MKTVKVLEVTRKGNDYGFKIPAGTTSDDIEYGLVTTLLALEEREKQLGGSFSIEAYLRRLGELSKCIKQGL